MLKKVIKNYLPFEVLKFYRILLQNHFEKKSKYPRREEILKAGRYTYGQENIRILFGHSGHSIELGAFCSISTNVTMLLGGGHRLDRISTFPFGGVHIDVFGKSKTEQYYVSKGSIVIGNDVWIGIGATIMPGVTVGDGAVIAANSHVVADIPPYAIYGGNPSHLIKFRFSENIIKELLSIKWWEMDDQKIQKAVQLLTREPDENVLILLKSIKNE